MYFEVIGYRIGNHGGGVGANAPSHGGTFLDFGILKPGVWWVINSKSTLILAPNVYHDCRL